jgi:hypothetical protein
LKANILIILSILIPATAFSIPIDWQGSLGFDSTIISEFDNGHTGNENNEASFQTYLFKLSPSAIINDSATINAEFTTGYGRGGRLGDDSTVSNEGNNTTDLYYHHSPSSTDSLVVNHLYAEIFGTTATYLIGRHPYNWALGAIFNDGKEKWSRHITIRDGITMKINLGNFKIEPFISKRYSSANFSANGKMEEYGATLEYQNLESDLALGIYYAKIQNNSDSNLPTNSTGGALGKSDVKVTDFYIEKNFKDTKLSIEVPIISGTIGDAYGNGSDVTYSTQGFIFEGFHQVNNKVDLKINAGHLQGDDTPGEGEYNSLFLHPNYHVANILFRYNTDAISNSNKNMFDSYMTNTFYGKLEGHYKDEKSLWKLGLIYAKANEVTDGQADDLGFELDLNYNYQWNDEMSVQLNVGYLFAGDYFAGATPEAIDVKNSYLIGLGTILVF